MFLVGFYPTYLYGTQIPLRIHKSFLNYYVGTLYITLTAQGHIHVLPRDDI